MIYKKGDFAFISLEIINIKFIINLLGFNNTQLLLKEDIKQGIANKEFKAYFQPKYGKDGKTITGAEALVR